MNNLDKTSKISAGISILSQDFKILYVNSTLRERFNLSTSVRGKHCYRIYHNRNKICDDCVSYRALKNGSVESGYYERNDYYGKKRLFQLISAPMRDDDGNIKQILEVSIDITETKNLNQKLRESEAFYRTLFEHSGTAIVVIDDDKTILRSNKKFGELVGQNKEEIEGKLMTLNFVSEGDRDLVAKIHKMRRDTPGEAPKCYELNLLQKDGKKRLVEIFADTVPDSKISIASLIDISEKRRLEKKISEQDQLLRNIIENSADAIIHIDGNDIIQSWNRGAQDIFEYKKDEVLGKPFSILLTKSDIESGAFDQLKKTLKKNGYVKGLEAKRVTRSGKEITCNVTWTNLKDISGNVIGSSAIIRDISAEKLLFERVLYNERMSALGELAASLAHEIKNPLNSMIINLEVLKGLVLSVPGELSDKTTKYTKIISSEIERLDKVIKGFLNFAKPITFESKKIDIARILDNLVALISHQAIKAKVEIQKEYKESGYYIAGDEDQLKQSILNLLLNSIQAMPDSGMLKIKAERTDRRKNIAVSISDTGHGIEEKNQKKIFDLYYSTKEKGSGFGLPIVKRIVSSHQGEISVESEVNKGTTFLLKFPAWKD